MRQAFTLAVALVIAGGLLASSVDAQPQLKNKTYHFGTHPARTNITFVSEADLETIHGYTNKVQGSIKVDANGTKASGTLRVGVGSLKTGIDLRDEHLRSDQWLDAKRYPYVQLQLVSATETQDPRKWSYVANLTIKGVTRQIKGTARISAIPDRLGKSLGGGSWVRVRTKFDVKITDYGVKIPQQVGPKVSDTWSVGIDLYGTTAAPSR